SGHQVCRVPLLDHQVDQTLSGCRRTSCQLFRGRPDRALQGAPVACVQWPVDKGDAFTHKPDQWIDWIAWVARRLEKLVGVVAPASVLENRPTVVVSSEDPEPDGALVDRLYRAHVLVNRIRIRTRPSVEGIDRNHGRGTTAPHDRPMMLAQSH